MTTVAFHHAFPVKAPLEATTRFYCDVLGAGKGRVADGVWQDFDFFGHQVVAHVVKDDFFAARAGTNHVDGHNVPVPHFGAVLKWDDFDAFVARLRRHNVKFEIEPYLRFAGQPGEQRTCFLLDPSGNALEFKCFKNTASLFAT
eukprot:CAMPEP_0198337910 /NCGR_PEP_ID=MMETSP1450-20131203/31490_1 /TAXON_ID=753684 ORGANISM="Madagascaria erythrocladiodes, Strain CCMP3234" /NCGR_SAMPLE_ID=MMETSP1450 /ASSEMBLY_ACC=CAM_ASM_001115 /LENGTH=143 /DNA_ID=CAMNT_0044042755 /DNA_START=22 /DNA_END=453 /DNA_ORIENTATION=-